MRGGCLAVRPSRQWHAWKAARRCGHTSGIKWTPASLSGRRTPYRQIRSKSQTTVQVESIPSRNSTRDPRDCLDGPVYPTVVRQARENMRKHDDCVVLTRVGSFYELYFEQADRYGPLLNLKVAQKLTAAGHVSMAGFPFYQLDRFLKILVQDLNEHVAISEEFINSAPDRAKSALLFDRRVARVVTPGTLIDERFMDPYENNFLLAVHFDTEPDQTGLKTESTVSGAGQSLPTTLEAPIGLAWLDLSTGDFFTQQTRLGNLSATASRIGPKEVICNDQPSSGSALIQRVFAQHKLAVLQHRSDWPISSTDSWNAMLESKLSPTIKAAFSQHEICAANILLSYVKDRLQGSGVKLQTPIRKQEQEIMRIDASAIKALEVLSTSKEGFGKGSLLHTMRRTVTRSGARLLRDWVSSPSMSLQTINARLDLTAALLSQNALVEQMTSLLKRSYDSQRLIQKFSMGRGDADDLVSLAKTIKITQNIALLLTHNLPSSGETAASDGPQQHQSALSRLVQRLSLDRPSALAEVIQTSIDEDGLMESQRIESEDGNDIVAMTQAVLQSQGSDEDRSSLSKAAKAKLKPKTTTEADGEDQRPWIAKRNASYVLQDLHAELEKLQDEKNDLAEHLRKDRNAQSLTLRWTPGLGHICHIKGRVDQKTTGSNTRLLKATKSTTSFHDPHWSKLGARLDQARLRIRAEEQNVLRDLRAQVIVNLIILRRNATVLDELDIACSSAKLAAEQRLVRPKLNTGTDHSITGGRHPTVQIGLTEQGRSFISNDCYIGEKERIWLITGPNMAGKSTFLRQNALISIMAQSGSFVPAESAAMGLVDQIFTRVGSADNLYKDQSTFMVEMIETAAILKHATSRSLVIMDEIGRGTTPEDGIAIGYACLDHLYRINRCRTLFATHFHALADMSRHLEHLACYCTDISESQNTFAFVHRLRPGVNRSSHALKVAALAGVPQAAIETARNVLEKMASGPEALVDGTTSKGVAVISHYRAHLVLGIP